MLFSLAALFPLGKPLQAWWWTENQAPTPEETIQEFQKQQADRPQDPYANYNLGVALYKAGKYGQAQTNFDRASIAATTPELKERSFFNFGNSLYKDTVSTLPTNWEMTDIEPEKLETAIAKATVAIKKYDSMLLLDKRNNQAQANKKKAYELLEKLEKKRQKSSKKDQQQGTNTGPQGNSPQAKGQEGGDQANGNNQPNKNDRKESPQDIKNKGKQGKNGPSNNDDTKKDQQQNAQSQSHDKPHDQEQPKEDKTPSQGNSAGGQKQESGKPATGQPQQENMEQRGMRVLLDNLQQDEANLQKRLVSKKLKENEKPQAPSQRPW